MPENPYKCTEPLDPEKDQLVCIPRHETVEEVVEGLKNGDYWVVMGPAQIGKTTFMRQVEYKIRSTYNIYLNFKYSPGDEKKFYHWMMQQMIEQIPHDSSQKFKKEERELHGDVSVSETEFISFLKTFQPKDKSKQIGLFLDEVEDLPFLKSFLPLLRSMHAKVIGYHKYSIIMTGSAKLASRIDFSQTLDIAKTLYLGNFSEQQSQQLINEPFKQLGISIDDKAKKKLIGNLNGHPQMLQQSCHFLIERAFAKNAAITISDVNDAFAQVLKTNRIFLTLEQDFNTQKELRNLVKRILNGEQINYSLYKELSATGVGAIVEGPGSYCSIRNEIFKKFLKGELEKEHIISSGKILIGKPSNDNYLDDKNKAPMPCAVKQLQVKNYHGIIDTGIHLPIDARWIFLTGENAYGKTAILRALTVGLFGSRDQDRYLLETDSKSEIAVEIYHNGKNLINNIGDASFKSFNYFAAYGPSRLMIQSDRTTGEISGRSTRTYSMFNPDGVSLNIDRELLLWYLTGDSRYAAVREILLQLLPHGADIEVDKEKKEVLYTENENKENGGFAFEPIPLKKLAAGNRSIIAMIGDLIIRFDKEYEKDGLKGTHPMDFEGIVIIDELDIHLHPKWLRRLPGILSRLFPKIQFIAATHSEIPVLGAPKDSALLKVTRTQKEGIRVEMLHVDFKNLLPHHLLTSPIFDLDEEIIPEANERLSDMKTLDNYYKSLEIDEIMDDLK